MPLIKVMSDENRGDAECSKGFTGHYIGPGQSFRFYRQDGIAMLALTDPETGESITMPLSGNAYVVSDAGKTIATFSHADVTFSNTLPSNVDQMKREVPNKASRPLPVVGDDNRPMTRLLLDPNDPRPKRTLKRMVQALMGSAALKPQT